VPEPYLPPTTTHRRAAPTPGSVIGPWVDFLCVGGLSIVLMSGLLLYILTQGGPDGDPRNINFGQLILLQALINWPHFMASYRLLYIPKENIAKYPFAAIYVPGILLIIVLASLGFTADESRTLVVDQDISYFLWLGAAFYLAWHYTVQAWGMVASFAFLAGITMSETEKLLIRSGLRILLAWHVVWGAQDLPATWLGPLHPYIPELLKLVSIAAFIAFFIGIGTFIRIRQRTGLSPTPQMIAPWLAIYLWYLVLNFEPDAYMLVQLSHALQYLIFPLRIELNRAGLARLNGEVLKHFLWGGRYYGVLLVTGCLVFYVPGALFTASSQPYTIAIVIASVVSIHHYFVDGSIWKISNRDVRKRLFSHLGKV